MTWSLVILSLCLLLLRQEVAALQVTPGSPCAAVCLDDSSGDVRNSNASSTTSTDIVCNDEDYTSTASGIKFKNCVECLQESHAVSNGENDISWYLYNLRYSLDVCLYAYPNATKDISSPCDIDFGCRPLKDALATGNLNPNNGTQLDYCSADGGAFSGSQLDDCIQCFRSSSNQFYMSNFLTALQAGCEQKPQAGNLIGLSGSLFTQFEVNITAAPQNETAASSDDTSHTTTMTTGAIVGIVVGASLVFLGGLGLFWVYHRKQKYQYAETLGSEKGRKSITPPLVGGYPQYSGHMASLPAGWDMPSQQSYSNNAKYYDRTGNVMPGAHKPTYAFNPTQTTLPTHPAYIPRIASRTASRNDTPSPPPQPRSNRPDTFAMNSYLNAAAVVPPYNQPLQSQSQPHQSHPAIPPASTYQPNRNLMTHLLSGTAAPPPPPPPPPPGQAAPRLSLPSKARKPTKYVPPSIIVDRPPEDHSSSHSTPPRRSSDDDDDDADEVLSIGLEISAPMARREREGPRWEQESAAGYGVRTGTPPVYLPQQQQQSQNAGHRPVDRRRRVTEFTDIEAIHSANSDMY
ncbi:hypothetical protein M426DRAFT_326114 [Hypoxylon sp. CI-4A]|nr:hypothetical protein M426DRAFT_326114 [Hypoxylon sp. CI-4A]